MGSEIRIRDLSIDDYDRIAALWEQAGLPFRPRGRDRRDRVEMEMAASRSVYLGAEHDGELVGVVVATDDGRKGWINRLAVKPTARRRGVARALVAAAEARLSARGILIIACLIELENVGSLELFADLGYVRADHIAYVAKRLDPDA
jgi:N-acetylglutamate synthase